MKKEDKESLSAKIGKISRKVDDIKTIEKKWKGFDSAKIKTLKKKLDDKELSEVKALEKAMRDKEDISFREYKGYFTAFCRKVGLTDKNELVISKIKYDGNTVIVSYVDTNNKQTIPNGSSLYHITSFEGNISELKPTFRGKPPLGYLYSSPRVYMSVNKNSSIMNLVADYNPITNKGQNRKHKNIYKINENIRTVYVDPFFKSYLVGAVYVQTNNPIKVTKISSTNQIKESYEDETMNNFENIFIEEMVQQGIVPIDGEFDVVTESISATMGKISRSIESFKDLREKWKSIIDKFKFKKWLDKIPRNKKELEDVKKSYNCISNTDNFKEYKKNFAYLCKFFGLDLDNTVIEDIIFKDDDTISCRYSTGSKVKVVIPNGSRLMHVSPNKFSELVPTFRSKTKGKYLYPSKRAFFTISKEIKKNKAGLEHSSKLYKYTPKENIKTAYIDPSCISQGQGSVFIDTQFNIPVKDITNEKGENDE